MTIKNPSADLLPSLKELWKEAFGDTDEFIECFFSRGFSPERSLVATDNETLLGALYWLDMECDGKKIAYVYGVATAKAFRSKGIGSRLMNEAKDYLKAHGYALIALVPATSEVFRFYEGLGYKTFAYVDENIFSASDKKVNVRKAEAAEYLEERKKYCKTGYLAPVGESLDFLEAVVDFYVGDDFVASLRRDQKDFFAVEFLGNLDEIPNFINSLGYPKGTVRTDGRDKAFAMCLPLEDSKKLSVSYLGFAFD